MCKKIFSYHTLQYVYRRPTLQFISFLTLRNLNKTSDRTVTHTSYKMHENRCVLLSEWYTRATYAIHRSVHSNWQLW